MAQTLRGDLTSEQEAGLIDLLAEKVSRSLATRGARGANDTLYIICSEWHMCGGRKELRALGM